MGPLAAMIAKAPAAVHHIAGRDGDDISEEIAELAGASEALARRSHRPDAKRGDERAADHETGELRDDDPAFGGKRRKHFEITAAD